MSDCLITDLSETLLTVILSYSSAPDLIQVLDTHNAFLIQAARLALSNAKALHCSYLLELDPCRNHGSGRNPKNMQERCIVKLLDAIGKDGKGGKLERIELAGLRHVVGNQGDWLGRIFGRGGGNNNLLLLSKNLTSIDFSGCAMLDPRMVHSALLLGGDSSTVPASAAAAASSTIVESSPIVYLNFQGCYRIDAQIVTEIATSLKFRCLQSLGIGGCSQTIGDACVHQIIAHLRELRFLDLSGLKRITEHVGDEFQVATETLQSLELSGCELLRFASLRQWSMDHIPRRQGLENNNNNDIRLRLGNLIDTTQCTPNYWESHVQWRDNEPPLSKKPMKNLSRLNFNGIGTPRRGLVEGALPYFALRSMGALREVYLSGCEQVQDWEIDILARVCANSLTVLEMRACCIGDDAVRAVGLHCSNLSDVDFSACFDITDEGILSFCQYQGIYEDVYSSIKTRRHNVISTLRSFKIAALPQLTNDSILAIAALESLLVLDISNCPKVTSDALAETLKELSSLVEIDAKGIGKWSSSVAALYSYDDEPRYLRFVNGRPFQKSTLSKGTTKSICFQQCKVRQHSKRFGQGVPLQAMYHCVDCRLIPSLNRGMCKACSMHCHKDHTLFLGSYTRFYCDCPFGIVGSKFQCQAIARSQTQAASPAGADNIIKMSS